MTFHAKSLTCVLVAILAVQGVSWAIDATFTGEFKQWHRVTLTLDGPETSEQAEENPFTDYELEVTFTHGTLRYVVPGFYAADGQAAETSASQGNKWRAHFTPDAAGQWQCEARLWRVSGSMRRVVDKGDGTFKIQPSDKTGTDNRSRGILRYVGTRYLQYAGTGEYYLKGGADSPENFLAYADFDGTYDSAELKRQGEAAGGKFIHTYTPHLQDWKAGDPTWKNGKGKAMIGALNYLAAQGMNSVYFLPYNIDGGDGKDVWPWTSPEERYRFDCSKLDQWEIVFSHMDRLGLTLHVILQEQENDQGLDGGDLGAQRRLYFRELIARFAHHPALVWNLGEENTNTDAQRKAFCQYIRDLDPYDHPIVCHTFPGQYDKAYAPLLGFPCFEGPSLQTMDTHEQTIKWIDRSVEAGRAWFVCLDEVAQANIGVKPDTDDFWHDEIRSRHLWGNLMAGGAGVEWYFGYEYPNNDLNCEDWRSRDHMWTLTRHALTFFHQYLPFTEMQHHDELTSAEDDYCLAQPGRMYAVYLPQGGSTSLDLGNSDSKFTLHWYNPRTGGSLQQTDVAAIQGPGLKRLGDPPSDPGKDWVALIRR